LTEAISELRRAIGISEDAPIEWVIADRPSFYKRLTARFDNRAGALPALADHGALGPAWALLDEAHSLRGERVWARLPFDIELF
jgi:hypothetical protein